MHTKVKSSTMEPHSQDTFTSVYGPQSPTTNVSLQPLLSTFHSHDIHWLLAHARAWMSFKGVWKFALLERHFVSRKKIIVVMVTVTRYSSVHMYTCIILIYVKKKYDLFNNFFIRNIQSAWSELYSCWVLDGVSSVCCDHPTNLVGRTKSHQSTVAK